MPPRDVALRALHAKVDFEVVDAAAELGAATQRRSDAQRRSEQAAARCDALLLELRRLHGSATINPAAIEALRIAYRGAVGRRTEAMRESADAARAVEERRDALALLRKRARHLEHALRDEAAAAQSSRAVREHATLDDLWLARAQAGRAR